MTQSLNPSIPQSLCASPLTKHRWLWPRLVNCSVDAIKVLAVLDANNCYDPSHRMTDIDVSVQLRLVPSDAKRPHRSIIDSRRELVKAGLVLPADGCGSYIVLPGANLVDARACRQSLRRRGIHDILSSRALQRAIDLYEQHARPAESTGQGMLGLPVSAGTPKHQMEALTR